MMLVEQIALLLLAAVLVVPVLQKLRLGSVLGYLIAGMVVGPWGFSVIGDVDAMLSFSELGVVLLLFVIGLELEPARLWTLRGPILGLGSLQVGVTGAIAAGMTVLGFHGGSHCLPGHADKLRAAGATVTFDDMRQLPGLIAG